MLFIATGKPGTIVDRYPDLATALADEARSTYPLFRHSVPPPAGYPVPEDAEPVARTGSPSQDELCAYARARSYDLETAGVTVGGLPVSTSRESQGLIDRAVALLAADPSLTTVDFDAGDALPMTLAAEQVRAVGVAVGRHVQRAFSLRAAALRAIAVGTASSHADVDAVMAGAT